MGAPIIQRSFAAGEIGPALYGRADQARYQTGLKTCRNFAVMRYGGVTNRTGSQFIAEVKDSTKRTYLLKFVFNDAQTYVIEAGDRYFRFYRDAAQIVVSGVAAWSGATNYVVGDLVLSGGVNYYCILANIAQVPPNVTYWYPLSGAIYEIPTPYVSADLSELKVNQSADVVTLTHRNYQPRELRRTGHTSWTLVPITTAPSIAAPTNLVVTTGAPGALVRAYVVTAVAAETYEESLVSNSDSDPGVAPTAAAPFTLAWTAVSGAVEYNVYLDRDGNGVYGFIASSGTNAFNDVGLIPDLSITPPIARALFASSGNYPATSGYFQQRQLFASTTNDPEKVWTSKNGSFKNFSISSPLQDDDAVTFTIAGKKVNEVRHLIEFGKLLVFTSGSESSIEGDSQGVLTPAAVNPKRQTYTGASTVPPVEVGDSIVYVQARGSVVRDLFFEIQVDGYHGNELTIFAPHLIEGYQIERMDFAQIPQSIVWMVRDDGTILGLTYMREQQVVGWHHHDTDGTYEDVSVVPEGDEDAVYPIVNRTIGGNTKRYIERFASRRVTDIKVDALFLDSFLSYDGRNTGATTVTLTTAAGWTVDDEITVTASAGSFVVGDVGNAVALLDGDSNEYVRITITSYTSATVVKGTPSKTVPVAQRAIATTVWSRAVDQVAGLSHLEGKTVGGLGDGNVLTQAVVASGSITLDRPYSMIHIGIPYVSDFETLDLDIAGTDIRDKKKRIQGATLLVSDSRGVKAGPDASHLDEFKPAVPTQFGQTPELLSGLLEINVRSSWSQGGRIFVRQADPLPLTILSAITFGDSGG